MKKYNVYFSDYPTQPLKVQCKNKTEARKMGRQYGKIWGLKASIVRIEEGGEGVDISK